MANKVELKNIVGEGLLNRIQNSYLQYMESSAAIYETNGDYAVAIFSSRYCDYLNQASRRTAGKTDDEALKSGKWICHEDCWATSLQSIKERKPCEIECSGGIKIYAAPIIAEGTVIGSNNLGASNPPTDEKKIGEIAQRYKVDPKELLKIAKEYSPRPENIINAVKNHVSVAADTIAEFFLRIKAEEELQKSKDELEYRVEERTAELKSAIELLRDESDERKKIDKELKVSEKKYRNVVDNAIVGVVITNFNGEILYINNALVKMLEYESSEEITREKFITKYKNPDQREAIIKIIKEKGRLDNHELELVTKTGKVKNILLSSVLEGNNMTSIMVDATERKHAEVSLRKSKIWLNSVLDQLNEGVMVISLDRLITYVNKTMEKMFGYSKDEFLGHSTRMLHVNDEQYLRLGKIIKKEFEKNDRAVIEFDFKRKNGEVFLAENVSVYLRDESGTVTGYIGVIRDISDRTRVEQALKESEKKYRALFEEAPDGIVLFDIEKGIYAEFNDKAHNTLGYTREEFQKLTLSDIEAAESPDEIQKHTEKLFKHGSDVFETKHRKKDGEILDILVSAQALTIGEKKFGQAIYTDINKLKKTEEAIKNSEMLLRNAQRVGHLGFWDWNIITGDLYWSDETYIIYGFQPQEFVPTFDKFKSILHPDDTERVMQKVEAALNNIEPYNIDFRFIYPDGNIGWIHVEGEVDRNNKGEPVRFFGTQINITESKQAESELIKAKEEIEAWSKQLEQRVKEKTEELLNAQAQLIQSEKLSAMGQMAGGLAHELNSPLAGLLPMIEQYKNEVEKDSKRYKELSLMHQACEYMAKIVRDFGSFSRESKGEFSEFDLNKVIDDTLGFSASRIKQKGIQVIREYKDTLPKVNGERTELQQVVLNMITNSLDAMNDGGELTIRTDISKDKNNVIMEYIDNGAGIEREYLGKIFDPFYTTKRPGKGTGLGLSVSYKIIEKHGGNISVESEPEKGTKFTIILPAVKSDKT